MQQKIRIDEQMVFELHQNVLAFGRSLHARKPKLHNGDRTILLRQQKKSAIELKGYAAEQKLWTLTNSLNVGDRLQRARVFEN